MTSFLANDGTLLMYLDEEGGTGVGFGTSNINNFITFGDDIYYNSNIVIEGEVTFCNYPFIDGVDLRDQLITSNLRVAEKIDFKGYEYHSNSITDSNAFIFYDSNRSRLQMITPPGNIQTIAFTSDIEDDDIDELNNKFKYFELCTTSNEIIYGDFCNIPLNTNTNYNDKSLYDYSPEDAVVTINNTGMHLIFASMNINTFSNETDQSKITLQMTINSNATTESMTTGIAYNKYTSMNTVLLKHFTSNDYISFQSKLENGNSHVMLRSNNGLKASFIRFPNIMNSYRSHSLENAQQLTNSYTDIGFTDEFEDGGTGELDAGDNGITVSSEGTYLIAAKINFISSNTGFDNMQSRITINDTYLEGTEAFTYTWSNTFNTNTCVMTHIAELEADDNIEVQSKILTNTNNVWLEAGESTLSVINCNLRLHIIKSRI